MDEWGIDVLVGASQKGLMLPPGLGFIWFSDKALEASQRADLVTPYWDWKPRGTGTEFWQYFGGTAPTHHLYGLREALTMILDEEGLPQVWERHRTARQRRLGGLRRLGPGHGHRPQRGRSRGARLVGDGGDASPMAAPAPCGAGWKPKPA